MYVCLWINLPFHTNLIEMYALQVECAIVVSFVPYFEVPMCDELLQLYLLHFLFVSSSIQMFQNTVLCKYNLILF